MLATKIWLELPQATRKKVATYLEIPRSGVTEVSGGRVISDGYTMNDLAQINLERLQKLFNTEDTDFYKLFNRLVANLEAPMIEVKGETEIDPTSLKPGQVVPLIEEIGPSTGNIWCQYCSSKGKKHLKTCTRPTK